MRSIKLISYSFAAILPLLLSLDATAPALARGTDRESFGESNEGAEISVARIAGPFEFPWSIGFLPGGSILVTERTGRLQLVGLDLIARDVGGVPPILSKDHGGLLDVAVDASFSKNRFIYLSYVHGTAAESVIRVLRAKLDDSNGALTEQQIIFESFPPIESAAHVAGRVVVTSEGYLFLTLGDRRKPELAQNPFNHVGAIIRIRRRPCRSGNNSIGTGRRPCRPGTSLVRGTIWKDP
jgi:aldose sugar dehydrogenase